jgi:hypothetical protein
LRSIFAFLASSLVSDWDFRFLAFLPKSLQRKARAISEVFIFQRFFDQEGFAESCDMPHKTGDNPHPPKLTFFSD